MTVGERLQSFRKQHNLSQEDLAKQLFVTRQTISLWETDQTLPTIDNLIRLKDILEVSIDDILTEPQDKPEENPPLESYEFKYSKPILKTVFKTSNSKSFWVHLLLTLLLILNTVRTYFVVTDDISKGLYWGFSVIAVIFFIRYIISIARMWNISKNNALKNTYKYDVFDGSIRITVTKDDEILAVRNITPESVSRCWSTRDLYIFEYQKTVYCIKKQRLNSNSHLHLFFYNGKQFKQKNTNALSITSNIFFILSFLTMFAGIICTSAMSASNNLYYENMWVFFLFLPIPIVSIILGVLKLKRREKGTKNIVAGIIMAFLLIIYGSFSFIYEEPSTIVRPTVDVSTNYDDEEQIVFDYVSKIEEEVKIDLPKSAVVTDMKTVVGDESWNKDTYYNVITIQLSDYDAWKFEKNQKKFELWTAQLKKEFNELLPPRYCGGDADYYILYNTNDETYNLIPTVTGEYKFWFLCYYADDNCFKVVDYTVTFYSEHKSLGRTVTDNTDDSIYSAMESVGLEGCSISISQKGHIETLEDENTVYIIKGSRSESDFNDVYLALKTPYEFYFYDFGEFHALSYDEKLYLADLDGDGLDEIIFHRNVGTSRGEMGYVSQVFKVNFPHGYFYEIFATDNANNEIFDSGFSSQIKDNYKIEISNMFTDYKTVLDFSGLEEVYKKETWDENGKVIGLRYRKVGINNFYSFEPQDIDNDGIYELVGLQYAYFYDYIGDAKTVLKYNEEYDTFVIVDAKFIPNEE